MLTDKPLKWREGQTIFNFLEFLANEKGIKGNQNARMADPFHLQDGELELYWKEFINRYKPQ